MILTGPSTSPKDGQHLQGGEQETASGRPQVGVLTSVCHHRTSVGLGPTGF